MNAAILAAGLGTRLLPLTRKVAKPLVPVLNRPLLGVLLGQLRAAGFVRVAVNIHHQAQAVRRFLNAGDWGLEIILSEEQELLGTAGGLKKLGELLGPDPFLAINGDVLTDLDLAAIFREHREGRLATLVLHDCPPHNHVWVGRGEMVRGIGSIPAAEGLPLAYTGIQVTGPEMLDRLPTGNYDLVKAWQEAIAQGGRLIGKVFSEHFWQDLGTPEDYLTAHRRLLKGGAPGLAPFLPEPTDPLLGPGVKIGPGVEFLGGVCLGAEVEVGEGASLKNTVVWDRARIAPGVRLESCIVAAGVQIADSAQGVVLG